MDTSKTSYRMNDTSMDTLEIQNLLKQMTKCLEKYDFLLNNHSVDFFVNDTFHSLPVEFQVLEQETVDVLLELATLGKTKHSWPFELKEFVQDCLRARIPRTPSTTEIPPLDPIVTLGMNEKKKVEVRFMAQLLDQIAKEHDISRIVDLGAGQGYLDQCLAYQYGQVVIGIDDCEIQTRGAMKHQRLIEKKSKGTLYHLNSRVVPGDTFQDIVSKITDYVHTDSSYLLVGLHACGDLSVSLLRQFVNGDAKAVVSVGCCYNHITEQNSKLPMLHHDSTPPEYGFPMSNYVKNMGIELGYSTRMTGTQATCRWLSERQSSIENFKKHAWRAMLQVLLLQYYPHLASLEISVGKLGRGAFKHGFVGYCKAALVKLKLDPVSDDQIQEIENQYGKRMNQVAVFWTLRGLLAETIESIILIDRLLYLKENSVEAYFVPLFPQHLSPRNMAIIGIKASQIL